MSATHKNAPATQRLTLFCDWVEIVPDDPQHPFYGRPIRVPAVSLSHEVRRYTASHGPSYPDGRETALCVVECGEEAAARIKADRTIGVRSEAKIEKFAPSADVPTEHRETQKP